jgi:hypothetical protein
MAGSSVGPNCFGGGGMIKRQPHGNVMLGVTSSGAKPGQRVGAEG